MGRPASGARQVGIEDVARAAGVSITTVSHAMNGRGHVSATTRERVREIAASLGYAPNRIASALRSQRSRIIGFVSDAIATTPYAGRLVQGAQDAAAARGQLLVVVNSNGDTDVESQQIAALLSQQVDAVVFARMFHLRTHLPAGLRNVPSVLIDTVDPQGDIPSVVPDEEQIARLATQTLIAHGHTRITHLTLTTDVPAVEGRVAGYTQTMSEAGLVPTVVAVEGDGNATAGRAAFAQLPDGPDDRPTAVFCFNDPMAMGVYQAAIRAGISIPEDLSVVGVDDFTPVAAELLPGLTTVALPHHEMGVWAIDHALALLDGRSSAVKAAHVAARLPGRLVERGSVARA